MSTPRLDILDKNYLINGNISYYQRGISKSGIADVYGPDRWIISGGFTGYSVSTVTLNGYTVNYLIANKTTTTNTSGYLLQRIESIFAKELIGETVTLQFYMKKELDSTSDFSPTVWIGYPTATDNYTSQVYFIQDALANSYTVSSEMVSYSYTFIVPALASNGLVIAVGGKGSTTSTLFNMGVTNITLTKGSQGVSRYCYFGKNYLDELQYCRRYYEKSYPLTIAPGTTTSSSLLTFNCVNAASLVNISFKTTKRNTSGTFTTYSRSGAINYIRNETSASDVASSSFLWASGDSYCNIQTVSGFSSGQSGSLHWTMENEI